MKKKIISPENFSRLKTYFIGAPSTSINVLIKPAKGPRLSISGNGLILDNDKWIFNQKIISASGNNIEKIRVENIGNEEVDLFIKYKEKRFECKFENDEENITLKPGGHGTNIITSIELKNFGKEKITSNLEIIARDEDGIERNYNVNVIVSIIKEVPYGEYNFNGEKLPLEYNFGLINPLNKLSNDQIYKFTVKNIGFKPLKLKLINIPKWLIVNSGNITSKPDIDTLSINIKPDNLVNIDILPDVSSDFMGNYKGIIKCLTNDFNNDYKEFDLCFFMEQTIQGPFITAKPPEPQEIIAKDFVKTQITIMNIGDCDAQVVAKTKDHTIGELSIPGAVNNRPGQKIFEFSLNISQLNSGLNTIFVNLLVVNGKQEILSIPAAINIIRITHEPELFDFGMVNPNQNPEIIMKFQADDKRNLSLNFNFNEKADKNLKDNINISKLSDQSVKARLLNCSDVRKILQEYNFPSISVIDKQYGYNENINIKFKRLNPILEIKPAKYEFGKINSDSRVKEGSFRLKNKGSGKLAVKLEIPDNLKIIKSPHSFTINTEKYHTIDFIIEFDFNINENTFYNENINIITNETKNNKHKFNITAYLIASYGIMCPACKFILNNSNDSFCRNCGLEVDKSIFKFVAKKDVVICKKCCCEYHLSLNYCPKDGTELKPI